MLKRNHYSTGCKKLYTIFYIVNAPRMIFIQSQAGNVIFNFVQHNALAHSMLSENCTQT